MKEMVVVMLTILVFLCLMAWWLSVGTVLIVLFVDWVLRGWHTLILLADRVRSFLVAATLHFIVWCCGEYHSLDLITEWLKMRC